MYQINPDGTGRTKVYEFDENVTVEDAVFAGDNSLYFVTKKLQANKKENKTYHTSTEKKIVEIDISTWKAEEVYSFENDTGTDFVAFHGFAQKDGILYATHYDDDKIYRIDIKTGKKDVLAEFSNSEIQAIWGDELYCLEMGFVNVNDGTIKENHMKCKSLPEFSVEIKAETKEYF